MDDRDRTTRVLDQARAHRTQMTPAQRARSEAAGDDEISVFGQIDKGANRSCRRHFAVDLGRTELAAFLSDLEGIVEHLAPSFALCVHPGGSQERFNTL